MKRYGLMVAALLILGTSGALAKDAYKPAVKVKRILQTETTTSGDPIRYPDVADPEVQTLLVEIPPGAETGWHEHPYPAYAYIQQGRIEVESAGGVKQIFKAGDSFAEMVDKPHDGRVVGDETVRILMIVTGEKGKPFSVKVPPPS